MVCRGETQCHEDARIIIVTFGVRVHHGAPWTWAATLGEGSSRHPYHLAPLRRLVDILCPGRLVRLDSLPRLHRHLGNRLGHLGLSDAGSYFLEMRFATHMRRRCEHLGPWLVADSLPGNLHTSTSLTPWGRGQHRPRAPGAFLRAGHFGGKL